MSSINGDSVTLTYHSFGKGPEILLCFSGFGRSAKEFDMWSKTLGTRYTLITIDHVTEWQSENRSTPPAISKAKWIAAVNDLLNELNAKRFSVLGYSLGGRVAIWTTALFLDRIDTVYLLAPDGLNMSGWYNFSVKTWLGRQLLSHYRYRPGLVKAIGNFGLKVGLISEKQHRLFSYNADSDPLRSHLFTQWLAYRTMELNIETWLKDLRLHRIQLVLVMGQFDGIIPAKWGAKIARSYKEVDFHTISTGHNLLHPRLNDFWSNHLGLG